MFLMEEQAMACLGLVTMNWMFVFQHIFNGIYAGKTKRVMHILSFGNVIDFLLFCGTWFYDAVILKDFRLNTFLQDMSPLEEAEIYWNNMLTSPYNENIILMIYIILLWFKAFYQLKLFTFSGSLFVIMIKMIREVIIFGIFYFCQLFLFAVVGVVLFSDLPGFQQLNTAMFTLFRATIQDYKVDDMNNARVGYLLGYAYFLSFLIINLTLIVNLVVG